MQTVHSLHKLLAASPELSVVELTPGYPVLRVDRPEATAAIALHGAHLISWQPRGEEPVIFTSPTAIFREGKAIRGGIPLCWPWFNAHPTDPGLPSHGFARNRFWQLTEVLDDSNSVQLKFVLPPDGETRKFWPHLFSVAVTFRIGATLSVELRTTNLDAAPLTVGGALHTYLAVGQITQMQIDGLDGSDYLDTVGDPAVRTQEGPLLIDREVDRIYRTGAPVRLQDRANNRAICLESVGSHSTVIWNPWIEKAAALGDLPDDAYRHFVCIETANAGADLVVVAPGQTHSLAATIGVES